MFVRDTLAVKPPVIRVAPPKRIYWRHCDNTMAAKLNNPGWIDASVLFSKNYPNRDPDHSAMIHSVGMGYSVVSGPWWKDPKYWGL